MYSKKPTYKRRAYKAKPRYAKPSIPMVKVEKKVNDIATAAYACDTTGSVTALNLIDEGTGDSARIGRKIQLTSVQIRGFIQPADADTGDSMVRVMLVWDKQVNGVIATIANILSAATANSFMNLDNRERFKVVCDEKFTLQQFNVASSLSGSALPLVDVYKKFSGVTIYDGTGGGIADINTGAMYLVTIGTAVAAIGATAQLACRVRYTDA